MVCDMFGGITGEERQGTDGIRELRFSRVDGFFIGVVVSGWCVICSGGTLE